MDVKIYMYKCNVNDNSNKRIKFHSKWFLYMYYLISKYAVVGGGVHLATNYYENSIPKIRKNWFFDLTVFVHVQYHLPIL